MTLLTAQFVVAGIDGDTEDPGFEGGAVEGRDMFPCIDERGLRDVIGLRRVAKNPQGSVIHRRLVSVDQTVEGV